jgi:hypothetical protein
MKKLENFNLTIDADDLILVSPPAPEEASTFILSKQALKEARENAARISKPFVVAAVGENAAKAFGGLKRGDYVFAKNYMQDVASLVVFDEERRWKNPIISPIGAVAAKITYTEQYEAEYDELIDKVEYAIVIRAKKQEEIDAKTKK